MSGSQAITFNTIPPNLRIPLVSLEFDNSQAGVNQVNLVTLLIGQTLTAQPMAVTPVFSPSQAVGLFGAGSMLASMADAYLANDNVQAIYCLPVPEPAGGVAASGTITVAGSATAAGTLALYCGGVSVPVTVNAADAAATIATNIAAAINANPNLPITASAAAAVVTYTLRMKGIIGNRYDVRLNYYGLANGEQTPAGLTVTIAAPSGGTGQPDLSGLDAILGDRQFEIIVAPYSDATSFASYKTLMNPTTGRFAPQRRAWGTVHTAMRDTSTNLLAAIGGSAQNTASTVCWSYYDSPTSPWRWAAGHAASFAVGIRANPAQGTQTLVVNGVLAPPAASQFTKTAEQTLLTNGCALSSYGTDGTVRILRAATTYQTNAYGQADQSYFDAETLHLLFAISRKLVTAVTQKYPRAILADDGTRFGAGVPVVTPSGMKAEITAQYDAMEAQGWVEDADAMAAATIVSRNANDNTRMDVLWAPFLTSGLRQVAIKNQFRLYSAAAAALVA